MDFSEGPARKELENLLTSLFPGDGLKQFAINGVNGRSIVDKIETKGSRSSYAYGLIDVLAGRKEIDDAFFDRLIEECPGRAADIKAVKAKGQTAEEKEAEAQASSTSSRRVSDEALAKERGAAEESLRTRATAVLTGEGAEALRRVLAGQLLKAKHLKSADATVDELVDACFKLKPPELIKRVGQAAEKLQNPADREVVRAWVVVLLPFVLGLTGMAEAIRRENDGQKTYGLRLQASCFGLIDCMVSAVNGRPARLTVQIDAAGYELLQGDRRIKIKTTGIKADGDVEDLFAANVERSLSMGFAANLPPHLRNEEAGRMALEDALEDEPGRYYVVLDEQEADWQYAKDFHRAALDRGLPVDVVLRNLPRDATIRQIESRLHTFFVPLFREALK